MAKIVIFDTVISSLNRNRTIRVCLPDDYESTKDLYPVLYMHDGQNLFSNETAAYGVAWDVHLAVDAFYKKHNKNFIVVGIDNGIEDRLNEYSPWKNLKLHITHPHFKESIDEGDLYLDWLVHDLVSKISSKFRTADSIYLAGSSMGANISLYAGIKYPKVFEKVGCFSPAFWFSKRDFTNLINNSPTTDVEFYLDIGTKESPRLFNREVRDTVQIYKILKKKKFRNLKLIIEKGAKHSETAWKNRFPGFLEWLLLQ